MEKLKRKNQVNKKYPYIIMGILLIGISCCLLVSKNITKIKDDNITKKSVEAFIKNSYPSKRIIKTKEENKNNLIKYIAVIEIPKINLKKGLVDVKDYRNNINYNIQILKESTFPNINYGNFILAAHSGNSSVSFFKNINKLNKEDTIIIYYNSNIYTYKVNKIYEIEKNGKTSFELDNKNTYITLITCIPNKNKQLVVVGIMM